MGINYFSSGNVQHHFLEFGDIVKGKVTKKIQAYYLASNDVVFMAYAE
jgi:hypothetical protein